MTAVFRDAAQTVVNDVRLPKSKGGHMPIDTGNLRRSLSASTTAMPNINADKAEFSENNGQITLTIAGANIGETLYFGFQAAYARRMEYGFKGADSLGRVYNQEGSGFVRLTAQRWPEIVKASAKKIKAKVKSR
ncbi:MAG: hypothetical protein COB78_10860 [Hyphomicrobiales bacterium]|nr:MAG: hypothetical protein COB78_10860 [Hyphomicrobiales bacterium]